LKIAKSYATGITFLENKKFINSISKIQDFKIKNKSKRKNKKIKMKGGKAFYLGKIEIIAKNKNLLIRYCKKSKNQL